MTRTLKTVAGMLILFAGLTGNLLAQTPEELRQQVESTERAFAKTMADRDFEAFASFLSEEAVFFAGSKALQGRQQVMDAWKPLYEAPAAPFSWEPTQVVVLESGNLALSSGPVYNPEGRLTGSFNSIWRRQVSGEWKVIFDKGCEACDCSKP
jgi:ketosteroid isomerase-like protein